MVLLALPGIAAWLGCVSSSETWRLLGSAKYQEFKAPPADELRYNQPPNLADLPRRHDWFSTKPQDSRDVLPAGPYAPPMARPSPDGTIR